MSGNPLNLKIRRAIISDLAEIQTLFAQTINSVCSKDYSREQLQVWTSGIRNQDYWLDKILSQFFLVAELEHKLVGFASLAHNDYIDLMYVHKDYQKQGIACKLLTELEEESQNQGVSIIKSDVSKTARFFFEKNGYRVIKEQTKKIDSVEISNFRMEKDSRQ